MAITSNINTSIGFDRQLNNLWEFSISTPSYTLEHAYCTNVGLPFLKLDTIDVFGKKFYGKVTQENQLSLEFWNDDYWKVFDYFDDWFNIIYDKEKQAFKSFNSEQDYRNNVERTARLTFQRIHSVSMTMPNGVRDVFSDYENSKIFEFEGLKILGIQDFAQDYENGAGMKVKVDMVFDIVKKLRA